MATARIVQAVLEGAVKSAVNGLIARIIKEETEKAQAAVIGRIAAETRALVVKVMKSNQGYAVTPDVNVVIHLPDPPNVQG